MDKRIDGRHRKRSDQSFIEKREQVTEVRCGRGGRDRPYELVILRHLVAHRKLRRLLPSIARLAINVLKTKTVQVLLISDID